MKKTIKSKILSIVLIMTVVLVFVGENTKVTSAAETVDANGITWSYEIDASGNAINVKPANTTKMKSEGSISSVIIPNTLGGNKVTSIGASAFYACTNLTSISIPDGVISIGVEAFCACEKVKSLIIPSSVKNIGDRAFAGCGVTSIIIPSSVIRCGYSVFFQCEDLTSISIQNNTDSIIDSAFYGCTSLTNISIPDSVTRIGAYSFFGCTSLRSISIPDSVTSISVSAFNGCTSLTSISIPDGVTSIDRSTFNGCTSLTSISIPDSVTSIGEGSFRECKNLESISIPSSVTSIDKSAFDGCTNLAKVYTNSDSYASKYDFVKGVVDTTTGYSAGSLIIELINAKIDAKAKLAKVTLAIPQSLFRYTNAGGLNTDSVYMYVNSYKSGTEIEAEKEPNKLIKWTAEIDDQITTLNTASKGLELTNAKTKLAQANSSLSRYITAGGKSTDSVYTELIKAIGGYTTDLEIEAETDANKLISLVSEVGAKINLLNIASQNLELINAKTNAKNSLDSYKEASTYRTAEKTDLASAISDGKSFIDKASTISEVTAVLTNVQTAIDSIKTDSQLKAVEKLAEELVVAKTTAKTSLDTYKDATAYREVQKTELVAAITTGKTNIDSAIVAADVTKTVDNAKTAIDAIKTDAQFTAEEKLVADKIAADKIVADKIAAEKLAAELVAAKTTSKTSLDTYKDANVYREAQKTELTAAINTGKTNIDNAIIAADVTKALDNAKTAIYAIKTDAQLIAEEKKNSESTKTSDVNALPLVVAAMIGMAGIVSIRKKKIA